MQGHQHEWQNLLLGFQSGPTNHQSWFGNYQITENVPHFNFTVTVFIVSRDSELRWMYLIPFISEPTPKSVYNIIFERRWLVQILLHYRCVVKVLIASGLKSERCWNSDIVWKFLTEQDDPQKTFAAFFWTDDWGQVKSFFGYVCLWVRTRIVCLWGRIKWQRKRYDFCLTPQACVPRGYTVKKKLQSLWLGGARRCDASVRAEEH